MDRNRYRFEGDKCFIETNTAKTGRLEFIIDTEDYNRVKMFHWHPDVSQGTGCAYLRTSFRMFENGKTRITHLKLHRLIASFPDFLVDHIDGNTFNNSKSNLREATRVDNNRNARCEKKTASKVKGVWIHKTRKGQKFRATIRANKKRCHLGVFDTLSEAADAYNKAAIEYFGEFARLHEV